MCNWVQRFANRFTVTIVLAQLACDADLSPAARSARAADALALRVKEAMLALDGVSAVDVQLLPRPTPLQLKDSRPTHAVVTATTMRAGQEESIRRLAAGVLEIPTSEIEIIQTQASPDQTRRSVAYALLGLGALLMVVAWQLRRAYANR